MITVNLILTIVGLLFVLIGLVALYVWGNKSKNPTIVHSPTKVETFETLSAVIKNRASSGAELSHAVEMILSRFGVITPQTIGTYKTLIELLCVHPHTDSKLVLRLEKGLRQLNAEYTREIEHSLAVGLAARG